MAEMLDVETTVDVHGRCCFCPYSVPLASRGKNETPTKSKAWLLTRKISSQFSKELLSRMRFLYSSGETG